MFGDVPRGGHRHDGRVWHWEMRQQQRRCRFVLKRFAKTLGSSRARHFHFSSTSSAALLSTPLQRCAAQRSLLFACIHICSNMCMEHSIFLGGHILQRSAFANQRRRRTTCCVLNVSFRVEQPASVCCYMRPLRIAYTQTQTHSVSGRQ